MYGVPVKPSLLGLLVGLVACDQDYQVVAQPPDVQPEDVTECGFTRIEGTAFWRYDCNPVFTSTGEDWADTIGTTAFNVTEVVGHPFYQLWYTGLVDDGSSFPPYAMGYAISPDGTTFTPNDANPVLEQSTGDAFDSDYMSGNQLVWDPDTEQYVMIWQGIHDDVNPSKIVDALGVATSADGLKWTRYAKNPVFDLGSDANRKLNYCWPLDLTLGDVSGYTGYVAGSSTSASGGSFCEVYKLNASSLGQWDASENVVLPVGADGAWDDTGMTAMSIAALNGQRYMFYVGFSDWTRSGNYQIATHAFMGMASYSDKKGDWEKEAEPIPVNMTEEGEVNGVEALAVGTRIHLWITDNYGDDKKGEQGVGYFIFDPDRAAEEEAAGG